MKRSENTPKTEAAPVADPKTPKKVAPEKPEKPEMVELVYNPPTKKNSAGDDEVIGAIFSGIRPGLKPGTVVPVEKRYVKALLRSKYFKKEGK